MADTHSLAWTDVTGGMNAADPPQSIAPNQVARMVNCALVNGVPTTRTGVRVVPLSGDGAEFAAVNNVQGSIFFNPAKGQGGLILGENNAMIAVAIGGRKYVVKIRGRRADPSGELVDITNGNYTSPTLHLAWLCAAENYLLVQDGQSSCFIWDSANPSFFSTGYSTTDRDRSSVPNAGTVTFYAHARIGTVLNSRLILVGDNLHRANQTSAVNLLDFVEQTYWATGQYFLPPTSVGNILAVQNMAVPGETNDGYAGTWFHLEDGLFAVNFNVYPRSNWSTTPMIKTALNVPGACGPYAVAALNADQIFRSRKGVMTLRWAIGQNTATNPIQPLSAEVGRWIDQDYAAWLRFSSLAIWDTAHRLLSTTGPMVHGRWRWHRGFVVRNMIVTETSQQPSPAWEGLWTMPPQIRGVVQFVNGIFLGEERQFAWTRGADMRNRLVELTTWLREDVLEDGSRVRIPCQIVTRAIDAGKSWEQRGYTTGRLFLGDIQGMVNWGVWVRTAESPKWIFWRAGRAENADAGDTADLNASDPRTLLIPLGKLPESCVEGSAGDRNNESRWVQFLIRWVGHCSVENLRISYSQTDLASDDPKDERFNMVFLKANSADQDDFEYYSLETPTWISDEHDNDR